MTSRRTTTEHRCESGACAQARELYAADRISSRDYLRGLCCSERDRVIARDMAKRGRTMLANAGRPE